MQDEVKRIVLGNGVHLAPLAGIADAPVRVLARLFGAGPTMSEMVSAHGVAARRPHLIEDQLMLRHWEEPPVVQLVGSDPAIMRDVAQIAVERGAASINLNMACPARKIVKGGKGCALMKTPELAAAIMRSVRDAVTVPVTVKIRGGWSLSTINAVLLSQLAEDSGMDAVILHPRTREQAFSGVADWDLIRQTVAAISIPVIGNGDIRLPDDARRMFADTGCAAVMVGRGAFGRPWLFTQILRELKDLPQVGPAPQVPDSLLELAGPPFQVDKLASGDGCEIARLIRLHVKLGLFVKEERIVAREVRKHVLWYSKGLPNASRFRAHIATAPDLASLIQFVDEFFGGNT
jgi:tRNA-dihydrouridine synthase B